MLKKITIFLALLIPFFTQSSFADNWRVIKTDMDFRKLVFSDSLHGWAVSNVVDSNGTYFFENDCIFKTTNGGQTWSVCKNFTGDLFYQWCNDLVAKDGYLCLAYNSTPFDGMGTASTVEFSNDSGNTWQEFQDTTFIDSWVKLSIIDTLNIWITDKVIWKWDRVFETWDSTGYVWFSDWEKQALAFCDTLNGYMAGLDKGNFYKTGDGGHSWDSLTTIDSLNGFICQGVNKIWAFCGSKIKYSSDSGKIWQDQNNNITSRICCIYALNDTVLWAGSEKGLIINTFDGGKTWQKDSLNSNQSVNSIFFAADSFGWASTGDSVLWGFGRAGLGVEGYPPPHIIISTKGYLRANPNPFSQKTTIMFNQNVIGPITVSIYNITGQLVINLVDEVKFPGEYRIIWNGRDKYNHPVTQGVYICQVKNNKYVTAKKIVLVK